jgi:hypothetical protein
VILSTFQHWKWPPRKWLPNNYLPINGNACAVHLNLLEVTNLKIIGTRVCVWWKYPQYNLQPLITQLTQNLNMGVVYSPHTN